MMATLPPTLVFEILGPLQCIKVFSQASSLACEEGFITKSYQKMRLAITTEIISRNLTLFYNMLAYGFSASIGAYSLGSAAPHFVVPNITLIDEFSESDKNWVRLSHSRARLKAW